ncbi:hypothetical protein QBC47DRAFT_366023 [Echria macrotheca]|uniref:Uncharacterized protein n=1 Tax=Echria macrotheca TaxID=438768 RepID=A0AAJ0B2F0_9PEZI|nr:hypothetical protein QBC47DRAFT_366023 [Echria macrotheca]
MSQTSKTWQHIKTRSLQLLNFIEHLHTLPHNDATKAKRLEAIREPYIVWAKKHAYPLLPEGEEQFPQSWLTNAGGAFTKFINQLGDWVEESGSQDQDKAKQAVVDTKPAIITTTADVVSPVSAIQEAVTQLPMPTPITETVGGFGPSMAVVETSGMPGAFVHDPVPAGTVGRALAVPAQLMQRGGTPANLGPNAALAVSGAGMNQMSTTRSRNADIPDEWAVEYQIPQDALKADAAWVVDLLAPAAHLDVDTYPAHLRVRRKFLDTIRFAFRNAVRSGRLPASASMASPPSTPGHRGKNPAIHSTATSPTQSSFQSSPSWYRSMQLDLMAAGASAPRNPTSGVADSSSLGVQVDNVPSTPVRLKPVSPESPAFRDREPPHSLRRSRNPWRISAPPLTTASMDDGIDAATIFGNMNLGELEKGGIQGGDTSSGRRQTARALLMSQLEARVASATRLLRFCLEEMTAVGNSLEELRSELS